LDNTVYCVGYSYLYAVSRSGTTNWKALVGDAGNFASPSVGLDGSIYIACSGCYALRAFRPEGTQKWSATLLYGPADSSAIGADGNIYFSAVDLFGFSHADFIPEVSEYCGATKFLPMAQKADACPRWKTSLGSFASHDTCG